MCLIAEVELETPLLAAARADVPQMTLSLQQETLPSGGPAHFFFWASGGDFEAFEAGLAADPTVTNAVTVGSFDDRRLYRADVAKSIEDRLTYPVAIDNDVLFLDCHTCGEGWRLRLQCPSRDALLAYRDGCLDRDLTFRLRGLYTDREDRHSNLTPVQREILELALQEGYFNIPRDATTGELGAKLDISSQSVSERLRRALKTVVTRTLSDASGLPTPETPEK